MLRHVVLSVAAAVIATPVFAQPATTRVEITPYAGYMIFGDFAKGPLGTALSRAGGALLGAQLGIGLTPNVALVGNVARASGGVGLGLPILEDLSLGSSSAWMFDGALQLSLPLRARSPSRRSSRWARGRCVTRSRSDCPRARRTSWARSAAAPTSASHATWACG